MVSKMIYESDRRGALVRNNMDQIRGILHGFWYEIINDTDAEN